MYQGGKNFPKKFPLGPLCHCAGPKTGWFSGGKQKVPSDMGLPPSPMVGELERVPSQGPHIARGGGKRRGPRAGGKAVSRVGEGFRAVTVGYRCHWQLAVGERRERLGRRLGPRKEGGVRTPPLLMHPPEPLSSQFRYVRSDWGKLRKASLTKSSSKTSGAGLHNSCTSFFARSPLPIAPLELHMQFQLTQCFGFNSIANRALLE